MQSDLPKHKHYTLVHTKEEADAEAWAFFSTKELKKTYFKFPTLGDDEMRANIIYTGLCHSDLSTARGHWGERTW